MIGMAGDYKYGGCLKTTGVTMDHITRQCVKCGEIVTHQLTSINPESFMSEGRRYELNKQREAHAIDMIQPIDQKTGKFNEEFGKHYGYNPMKTEAPQLQQNQNNDIEVELSGKIGKEPKLHKLPKK